MFSYSLTLLGMPGGKPELIYHLACCFQIAALSEIKLSAFKHMHLTTGRDFPIGEVNRTVEIYNIQQQK